MKKAKLDADICLGCGLCARACDRGGVTLRSRETRVITPMNAVHRVVVMAIERGNFQDLLFDNRVLWNHRALAAVLGVVLRLPPIKQIMASRQVKSRGSGSERRLDDDRRHSPAGGYDFGAYSACSFVIRGSRPLASPA